MPALSRAWRAITRFIERIDTYVTVDEQTEAIRKDRRAERRSLMLLMRLLNPEQRQEFRQTGHFGVTGGSSGDRYRIRIGRIANIDVLRKNGTVDHRLCAHPAGGVPVYDVMAAQMLYLQDPVAEKRLLQQARVHPAQPEDCRFSIMV
jgi:hypothetical protein